MAVSNAVKKALNLSKSLPQKCKGGVQYPQQEYFRSWLWKHKISILVLFQTYVLKNSFVCVYVMHASVCNGAGATVFCEIGHCYKFLSGMELAINLHPTSFFCVPSARIAGMWHHPRPPLARKVFKLLLWGFPVMQKSSQVISTAWPSPFSSQEPGCRARPRLNGTWVSKPCPVSIWFCGLWRQRCKM